MAESIIKVDLNKFKIDGEAVLVIDSSERGMPAKGGIRVHEKVGEQEIADLAEEMTKKNIIADLPFGGAKGGIRLDNMEIMEEAMFAFGRELAKLEVLPDRWCAAPDVNTDSTSVDAFVAGCASVKGWRKARLAATGKSTGIPHELGSTAYGVVLSVEEAIKNLDLDIDISDSTVIVEGIGEVGGNAVKILAEKGATIVGVSDITGYVFDQDGIAIDSLTEIINQGKQIKDLAKMVSAPVYETDPSGLLGKEADILILAGPGRSVTEENYKDLKVKIIGEGANIAYTGNQVRDRVAEMGIFSIPGIIANSGGVISSFEEWLLENENLVHLSVEEKWERVKESIRGRIVPNIGELCDRVQNCNDNSYQVALNMAEERLEKAVVESDRLEKATKKINKKLEQKFKVYSS